MIELTPELVRRVLKNGPTDPIDPYRRPVVGWLFRERINRGLRLLPDRRFTKVLEVGYGAGALQLALAAAAAEVHGIDLDTDPARVTEVLAQNGLQPQLIRGSVYTLPYPDASFDLVVCFSVFEHLHEPRRALLEVARVLSPDGLLLLGMPSVNRMMEAGFWLMGHKGIKDHHVTTPGAVEASFGGASLRVVSRRYLDLPVGRPLGLRLYHNWLLEKLGSD